VKRSEFNILGTNDQLAFIAEQAGVKWDAEEMEELPKVVAFPANSYEGCNHWNVLVDEERVGLTGAMYRYMSKAEALEAVRLLSLIPKIRKAADIDGVNGPDTYGRLREIRNLLSGYYKP
jgi:hypothetical protein